MGERLFEGGAEEAVLIGEADPKLVSTVRTQFPFLPDRR
jgi:predicted amidohydrolase